MLLLADRKLAAALKRTLASHRKSVLPSFVLPKRAIARILILEYNSCTVPHSFPTYNIVESHTQHLFLGHIIVYIEDILTKHECFTSCANKHGRTSAAHSTKQLAAQELYPDTLQGLTGLAPIVQGTPSCRCRKEAVETL